MVFLQRSKVLFHTQKTLFLLFIITSIHKYKLRTQTNPIFIKTRPVNSDKFALMFLIKGKSVHLFQIVLVFGEIHKMIWHIKKDWIYLKLSYEPFRNLNLERTIVDK